MSNLMRERFNIIFSNFLRDTKDCLGKGYSDISFALNIHYVCILDIDISMVKLFVIIQGT